MIEAYKDRENKVRIHLHQDDELVTPDVVNRAMIYLGNFCLDTDQESHPIELVEDNQAVDVQFGLIDGVIPGRYQAYMTIYTSQDLEGLAWGEPFMVMVHEWPGC